MEFDSEGRAIGMEEKPAQPRSPAMCDLPVFIFTDNGNKAVRSCCNHLKPLLTGGELEITDVNRTYLKTKALQVIKLGRGMAWLDTGTHDSLLQASNFIQTIEQRQGLKVACLEEIALNMGYITKEDVRKLAAPMAKNDYGQHLLRLHRTPASTFNSQKIYLPTPLDGVILIEPDVFKDDRGFFLETYHQAKYAAIGVSSLFVQDNHSRSARGTLRGPRAQPQKTSRKTHPRPVGGIFDVMVDIRRGSPTYKKWYGVRLSAENFLQCYIPIGYAHGFYVTSDIAEVEYKCTALYDPSDELHLQWNDPSIGIEWPEGPRLLSKKDLNADPLSRIEHTLPVFK